jgi:hypothetical protein
MKDPWSLIANLALGMAVGAMVWDLGFRGVIILPAWVAMMDLYYFVNRGRPSNYDSTVFPSEHHPLRKRSSDGKILA